MLYKLHSFAPRFCTKTSFALDKIIIKQSKTLIFYQSKCKKTRILHHLFKCPGPSHIMKPVADKHEEMLHYFDEKGNILGVLSRKEIHSKGLINKHVAYFVKNQKNELLFQLRAKDKSLNPNQWDKPGGHVGIDASLADEFLEEMCYNIPGISVKIVCPNDYNRVAHESNLSNTAVLSKLETLVNYPAKRLKQDGSTKIEVIHLKLFVGRYNGPIAPQPGEVQKIKPWSREELEQAIISEPLSIGYDTHDIMSKYAHKIFSK